MKRFVVSAVIFVLLVTPCFAGYTVNVTTKPGFREGLSKVLVLTLECHERLNCRDIERQVGARLPGISGGLKVVPVVSVGQALLDLGKAKYDLSVREQLLAKFEADAVLELDIPYGEKGVIGFKGSESAVSLRLVKADGTLLVAGEGSGRARNTVSSPENIAREITERILERAFKKGEGAG